jgi:hypothetical protein
MNLAAYLLDYGDADYEKVAQIFTDAGAARFLFGKA